MMSDTTAPLTDAELDLLARLDAARTPGPVDVLPWPLRACVGFALAEVGDLIVRSREPSRRCTSITDAAAIAAALNALPALLAEVRASRAAQWREPDGDDWTDASDPGPHLHIPLGLLDGA